MGHYLQRVTSSVALGAELVYQRGPRVPGGEITVLSLASKITGKTLRKFLLQWFAKELRLCRMSYGILTIFIIVIRERELFLIKLNAGMYAYDCFFYFR